MKLYRKVIRTVVEEIVNSNEVPRILYKGSWVGEDDKEGIALQENIATNLDKEYQGWTHKTIEEKFEEVK